MSGADGDALAAVTECPFCLIAAGEAPARIADQNADVIAFHPLNPVTEGHLLVVPREHVLHFMHKPAVTGMVAEFAARLAVNWMGGGDTNLITSAGGYATQTVPHLHFHIVPRSEDDGLALPWTVDEAIHPAEGECGSCGEGPPEHECPKSKRPCGHHCNHVWTHDACDWCGVEFGEDADADHGATGGQAAVDALRFRVEVACDGYSGLTDDDVPDHFIGAELDAYREGAAEASREIRAAFNGPRAAAPPP